MRHIHLPYKRTGVRYILKLKLVHNLLEKKITTVFSIAHKQAWLFVEFTEFSLFSVQQEF